MSKLTRVEYFGTRVPIIHPPNLVFFFGLPTRCALPDSIDRYGDRGLARRRLERAGLLRCEPATARAVGRGDIHLARTACLGHSRSIATSFTWIVGYDISS